MPSTSSREEDLQAVSDISVFVGVLDPVYSPLLGTMGGYMSSGVDDSRAKNKAIDKELQRVRGPIFSDITIYA